MKKIVLFFIFLIFLPSFVFSENLDNLKSGIYSKLKCCACTVAFEKCGCAEAKEMKAYTDGLIESGMSKNDIYYRVAKKFSLKVILDEKIRTAVGQRLVREASGRLPQIALETHSFDFGIISKKQGKATRIFKLYNKGNADLIITNIRVSCSCVTASLRVGAKTSPAFGVRGAAGSGWQAVIKPGETGELEVVLDLAHPSMEVGREVRDIFIASNDPLNSQATLRVEVNLID